MKQDKKTTAVVKKKKTGPSPALLKARKDLDAEKDKSKKARKNASEARADLRRIRGARVLRFLLGNAGGLAAGGVVEGIAGTELGEEGGVLDNDIKRCVVPAALGALTAAFAGDVIGPRTPTRWRSACPRRCRTSWAAKASASCARRWPSRPHPRSTIRRQETERCHVCDGTHRQHRRTPWRSKRPCMTCRSVAVVAR